MDRFEENLPDSLLDQDLKKTSCFPALFALHTRFEEDSCINLKYPHCLNTHNYKHASMNIIYNNRLGTSIKYFLNLRKLTWNLCETFYSKPKTTKKGPKFRDLFIGYFYLSSKLKWVKNKIKGKENLWDSIISYYII